MEIHKEEVRLNFLLGEVTFETPEEVQAMYDESVESVISNPDVDPDKRRELMDMLGRTRAYYLSKLEA